MREIKFRAWDKNNQIMYEVSEFVFSKAGIDWRARGDHAISDWRGEAELMQFTGLKDKNGKEIYEGDILRYEWCPYHSPNPEVQVVEWVDVNAGFFTDNAPLEQMTCDKYEVIGNTWENPELLK